MDLTCPYRRDTGLLPVDPCMDYLALRDAEPVRREDDLGVWVVTGAAEVTALLRSPALSAAWPQHGRTRLHDERDGADGAPRTAGIVRRWFMFQDEPRHQLLRGLITPLFATRRLAALQAFVEETVDHLLADVTDEVDVMAGLAVPLAGRVVCRLLGVGEEVAPRLAGWALDIAALLVADYLPEVVERGTGALAEIEEVVAAALKTPGVPEGTVLEVLSRAHEAGRIEYEDIAATASLLVFAGFDTTSTFIGKAVRALLHTGQWSTATTRDIAATVEELLRFDTSVQQVARVAVAPVEAAGQRIEPGDLVLLMLGVANRDPRVHRDPDVLDPGRRTGRHLTFGYGTHYCLGSGLARIEAGAALGGLARRWSHVEPAGPPVLRPHHGVTVLEHLRLRVRR
ncbi:cytochrome P450 [Streptomyces sp. NPDC018045]|uniref:cytochrome P450 n=1 Tax=Streptomyces sp. NPDC018045 TaxID=3365037 RepID=UPI0037A22712